MNLNRTESKMKDEFQMSVESILSHSHVTLIYMKGKASHI